MCKCKMLHFGSFLLLFLFINVKLLNFEFKFVNNLKFSKPSR